MNEHHSPPQPPPLPDSPTKGLLPTPISPTTTNHNFGSLISQFSLKDFPSRTSPDVETTTTKIYQCSECLQVFNRPHNLKSHQMTHSASKPFQCTDCDKQFLRQHDLKRHQKLHTGERPYHCPVCKRSFSRRDALHRHQKTEGGSACLKTNSPSSPTNKKKQTTPSDISPLFIPAMTSQWQVSSNKVLPHPSFAKPNNNNKNSASPANNTLTTTIIHHHHNSSPPLLPSLILPLNEDKSDELIEKLRQRIHDLEIENRVLRSLLCNNNNNNELRNKLKPEEEEEEVDKTLMKRLKRSP